MSCDYFGAKPVPGDGIEERCGMERKDVNHSTSEDVPQRVGEVPTGEGMFLNTSPPWVTAFLLLSILNLRRFPLQQR